jgi:hypothetical protein
MIRRNLCVTKYTESVSQEELTYENTQIGTIE